MAQTLFELFDRDHSQSVGYDEVIRRIHEEHSANAEMVHLQKALWCDDAVEATDRIDEQKESNRLTGIGANPEEVKRSLENLLRSNAALVMDLFVEWDDDRSGLVTEKEFARALRELGYEGSKEAIQALFDDMDSSGNYTVSFHELNAWLTTG